VTDRRPERIDDQFADRGDRASVWRVLDLVVDTDAYLNLGYAPWYRPYPLGASQRRLVTQVGRRLAAGGVADGTLLDVGCGRGGPAIHLESRFGADVTGVDRVPYNVRRARENARAAGADAAFVVGDATALPVRESSQRACTAIDSLVYVPARRAAIAGMADVLEPGGGVVVTDLLRAPGADLDAVDAFAEAWGMPRPGTREAHERAVAAAGLDLTAVEDVSAHSVGRFRRWTAPFLAAVDGPLGVVAERALRRYGLDASVVFEQIRLAHRALPDLRHVLFVAHEPR
jgi:SAM-dependent methyltransferase